LTPAVLTEVQQWRSDRQARTVLASIAQSLVEVRQLTHEVEVRRDVGSNLTQKLVCILERQRLGEHEISDSHGDRAADAGQTVDQHSHVPCPAFLYTTHTLLDKPVDELARALLSFKRPTRPHRTDTVCFFSHIRVISRIS